jgi:hypothetical protein
MPFGISPAPEEFQRRMEEALEGLEGIKLFTMTYRSTDVETMTKRPSKTMIAS